MEKFRTWYLEYRTEITWFVIGLMLNNAIFHLAMGQMVEASIDLILLGINYAVWRSNRV